MDLLPIFEAFDRSWLAELSKSNGAVFALVQYVHLASLALLGGMVLLCDLRLLNVLLRDIPVPVVVMATTRWIRLALLSISLSGIYQAAAVSLKLYYNDFFWAKMTAFAMGLGFLFFVKLPLVESGIDDLSPWTTRLVALASLLLWFSVAATGRWIGFS